jgi:protein-tyrosine phosphatase
MIDWHCHLLPHLDDGPPTMDKALVMAAGLQKAGFTAVYCTPHLIRGAYEADNGAVCSTVRVLRQRLLEEHIDVELFPGREYYLDEFLFDYLEEPLTIGEDRKVLLEIPPHAPAELVQATCFRLRCAGYIPLIAHPERCRLFTAPEKKRRRWYSGFLVQDRAGETDESGLLSYLIEIGCQFQGNIRSLTHGYGEGACTSARYLQKRGVYDCFGTDAHSLHEIEAIAGIPRSGNAESPCRVPLIR